MNNRIVLKQSVLAVAMALAASPAVLAQESGNQIQKVVVTGSNIKRIDAESATPVQIIKHDEITRLGVSSVKELLDTLTSASSSLSDIGGNNSFAGGSSSVSLRGLGKQSTLVLLNSRRVAPYALADYNEVFTNLDALPLDAVERIDILRNGGSAVYGSDAVAGVINIITRTDYQGLQASASHTRSQQNGEFRNSKAALTGGFGNLETDRYNVLANLEVYKRDSVNWRQLIDDINPAYGDKFLRVKPGSGLMFGNRGAPSILSYPGQLVGQGPLPGCTTLNAAKECVYDRYSRIEAVPKSERANLMLAGTIKLSENLQSFSEVLYSRTKTDYMGSFAVYDSTQPTSVWGNPSTGLPRSFTRHQLPAGHPLNHSGEPLDLRYRFGDDPGFHKDTADQYRVLTGLKGTLDGKYDWESAIGIMGSKTKDRSRGTFFSASGFKQVIGDYDKFTTDADGNVTLADPLFFNRDYKLGQKNSDAVLALLFPESGYDGKITQYFVDGKISGELGSFNGRPIGVAVGGDIRHEKFAINPTANLQNGDIVDNGSAAANASRYTSSVFGEANVPLATGLELVGAARVDKFKGVKAHVSPKLALRWEASKEVLLRGTVEKGFRAPNLTESAQSAKFAYNNQINDPLRCDPATDKAKKLIAQANQLPESDPRRATLLADAVVIESRECSAGVASRVVNNPNLKPETSTSATVGIVLEPVKGTSISIDYWRIKRKDEISTRDLNELLAAESTLAPGIIIRAPLSEDKSFTAAERKAYGIENVGPLQSSRGMFENTVQTKTSGVDVSVASRINTGFGRLDLSGNATYLFDYRKYAPTRDGGSWGDNQVGRYEGSPKSKLSANIGATLKTGDFSNSLRLTHRSSTQLRGDYFDDAFSIDGCKTKGWSESECRLGSYNRVDYFLSYTGVKNLTLSLFVRNLFNKRMPVDLKDFATSGANTYSTDIEDLERRSIRVMAEYKFW
ncbi:TonB-dependent siderophore receptor [Massilia sp. YIM B04103]|uniref:TonB-dependent receptor plug domain-containing protein n=1 Tax=Massilia sp. YIM B04103 TaxID=2963106 RepID=UPI00210AAB8B|nr:TonB-dependent receptor [Massilia sp. YIM B04103]